MTHMSCFPPNIQQYLPANTLSVNKFITLNLPSCTPVATTPSQLTKAKSYVSDLQPTLNNVNEITLLLLPSDNVLTTLQQFICSGTINSILCPHSPTAGGQRYPLWLVSFWIQLSSTWNIPKKLENSNQKPWITDEPKTKKHTTMTSI